jgi:hypothetical protein
MLTWRSISVLAGKLVEHLETAIRTARSLPCLHAKVGPVFAGELVERFPKLVLHGSVEVPLVRAHLEHLCCPSPKSHKLCAFSIPTAKKTSDKNVSKTNLAAQRHRLKPYLVTGVLKGFFWDRREKV